MDIAQLSMSTSQNSILQAVGASVFSKSLELAAGDIQMMDEVFAATTPSLESLVIPTQGTQIDLTV